MMVRSREDFWNLLLQAELVSGGMPQQNEPPSPWPVRVMLGAAGWLAACFLFSFAGYVFYTIFRSVLAGIPAGLICCLGAFVIFRGMQRSEFMEQFAIAASLAGQIMMMFGFLQLFGSHTYFALFLMAAFEVALTAAIPNYIHRIFTSAAANLFLLDALGLYGLAIGIAAVGASLLWLDPVQMGRRPSLWEPVAWGFTLTLLSLDALFTPLPHGLFWPLTVDASTTVMRSLFFLFSSAKGLVLIYVVWKLRERALLSLDSPAGKALTAAAVLVAGVGFAIPGIVPAILVLVLGFANSNRVLMGVGLLGFAGFLSRYYYLLSSTLLVKSITLIATGAVLLAMRWAINKYFPEEAPHDA